MIIFPNTNKYIVTVQGDADRLIVWKCPRLKIRLVLSADHHDGVAGNHRASVCWVLASKTSVHRAHLQANSSERIL